MLSQSNTMTTDTPSSRDEEIPTPRTVAVINDNPCIPLHLVPADFARQLERELIRLSAEREKERPVANRDVPTLFPTLQHEIESLRSNLAERDKELADERLNYGAQVACIQGLENEVAMWKRRAEEKQKPVRALGENLEELTRQLLAAQTVNGKMREALEDMAEAFDSDTARRFYGEYWTMLEIGACSQARTALALSPDPTLLDEVDDEDVKAAVALIVEAESECHAYNPSVTRISTRLHKALSRLRQSTRETEEKV